MVMVQVFIRNYDDEVSLDTHSAGSAGVPGNKRRRAVRQYTYTTPKENLVYHLRAIFAFENIAVQ